jgi:ribosomal protein S18 acetylase RimI-like enzyme
MEHNLAVREYQRSDFDQVNQLWVDTGMGGSIRGDTAEIIDRTIDAGGKLFILEDKARNEIIGTSWLTHDQRRIYLHHFGIKPGYQGKKFAHLLMKASMEFAQSSGMQIKLEVHRDNHRAVQLYRKWGFNYLGDYDVYIIRDYKIVQKNFTEYLPE